MNQLNHTGVCVCGRFQLLFKTKEKWTLEELVPYIE